MNVDLVCLDEHWMNDHEINTTIIKNFELISYFARTHYKRGGVCIYARHGLNVEPIMIKRSVEKSFEVCLARMDLPNTKNKIWIMAVYRTPDSDFKGYICNLESLLHEIYNTSDQYIICGDVNVNFLEESTMKFSLTNLLFE
ncbi:hypothetical protein JTB14_034752 [Gonioctena quinquepunctata]|nr:hypothetical protein JTB14_034752 [Gonioctena quinquepunctata]